MVITQMLETTQVVLKVMWRYLYQEWKIFLENSHFVWFPTESAFYLHYVYNMGRIYLRGTE